NRLRCQKPIGAGWRLSSTRWRYEMPQATELVGTARVHAASSDPGEPHLLYGLGELVDLVEGLSTALTWEYDRQSVALINKYQRDLQRDPGLASTRCIRQRKAQQCAN